MAFVARRQIVDPSLIANEIMDDLQSKKKRSYFIWRRVDWVFLISFFKHKGFDTP